MTVDGVDLHPTRPRVLVYRAIGLGDLLTGVPALRALRRAVPRSEIVLAAPAAQAPLVELADAVDRVVPTEELEPVDWTGPAPEVAIDLHGNGIASRRLLEQLSPGRLVAFETPTGPRWDPGEHERVRWCRLISHAFGVGADPGDVLLRHPDRPSPVPGATVIHPGAAAAARRWPPDRYAAVARALTSAGERVVITGSPAEVALAEQVRDLAGLPADAVQAGRTDLLGLAALIAEARLVISGDTGTAHLASAYQRPSVVLFGPTPPATWGPPPGPHTVLWHGSGAGDPHADVADPALLAIGVDEVIAAASAALRREPTAPPPSSEPSA